MIWWERLPKSPLGDFWGEESPLNPPWGTLRMQHKIIFLVFFGTVGILFSAVTRVDRVPTLSINSQHPNNSDRIGISFAERCFCPPGATLLSEFQHLRAFNHKQQYPKVPFLPLLSLILLSAVKRADRVPTLSNKGACPLVAFDRIGISFAERCFCWSGM